MNVTASICPLCRAPRLVRHDAQARCGGCGCRLEFDGATKRARVAFLPRSYAKLEPVLVNRWMTRREMFEAVERAEQEPDAAEFVDVDSETDEDERKERRLASKDAGELLPLIITSVVLVLVCLCAGAAAVGGFGIYLTGVWTRDEGSAAASAPASVTPAPSAGSDSVPPIDQTASPAVSDANRARLPDAPTPTHRTAPISPGAVTTAASEATAPAASATRQLRALLPTVAAPPAPTQAPQPLDSPVATAPPPEVPTGAPTLPPTFTPLPDLPTQAPSPTTLIPSITPTPPVPPPAPATPLPANTSGPGPTATPTYAPGSTRTGDVVLDVNHGEDYVRLTNTGPQQIALFGLKLRALLPGRPPGEPPPEYSFENGVVLIINGECKVYATGIPRPGDCQFEWPNTAGLLWPDTLNKGVTALLLDADGRELARFTY